MSNSALAKMARRSLDRVEKQLRETVETYEGQVFIWDVKGFIELIDSFVLISVKHRNILSLISTNSFQNKYRVFPAHT